VVQVRNDPREAYDQLFRESGATLIRAVYAYTGGRREIAEEAVAEAFARAMERDGDIRDRLAWIYRVSFRIAAHEAKREKSKPASAGIGEAPGPEEGLGSLVAALRKLSPAQRAAVVLHYEADLPVAEVSRLMGISAATVKVHLHRGRNKLRALLGDEEVEDDD
jgi:RNA polymerase sigma-70 factor (ECF subfamily)